MKRKKMRSLLSHVVFSLLILNVMNMYGSIFAPSGMAEGVRNGWLYDGWQYREEHNIALEQASGSLRFYDLSASWTTISGNPTARHAFQPVHNAAIVEANTFVDGQTRKYLAYDSDPVGSQIRLYYTNDTAGIWTPYSGNPILGPSSAHYRWPSTAYVNNTFHMFLTDRTDGNLERWTSTDGIHYSLNEIVKTGGNEYKTPFIWFDVNNSMWYLYTHDSLGSVEYVKTRSASNIENLDLASDTIVISQNAPFGAATVAYHDGYYWLLAEILESGVWKIAAYYSNSSPSIGFKECNNSPILVNDDACPTLLLTPNLTQAYLFIGRDSSRWIEETREVYLNTTIFEASPRVTDYQLRIIAHYGAGTSNGENVFLNSHSRTDFGDIRFAWFNRSSNSEVGCNYWVEDLDISESGVFWVKVPEITAQVNATLYVYYGKADATTSSNGQATFEFFDDFSGDLSKWTVEHYDGTGTVSVIDGWARVNSQPGGDFWGPTDGGSGIFHQTPLNDEYAIETVFRDQSYPTADAHNRFLMSRVSTGSSSAFYTMLLDGDNSHITTNWRDQDGAYASWAGENTGRSRGSSTTFHARLTKLHSTFNAYISNDGNTWYAVGSRTGSYHGYVGLVDSYHDGYTEFDWVMVRKYLEHEPTHGSWGVEETGACVEIDQAEASDIRADIESHQTIAIHAKWNANGSDIIGGSIYVNNTEYVTNSTGWISFDVTSLSAGKDTWIITGVDCNGVIVYVETAQLPDITWDQIYVVEGGATAGAAVGDTVTVWFKAIYAYDLNIFSSANGVLYANNSAMLWSATYNRWEYTYVMNTTEAQSFIVSGVLDNLYGLTAINDKAGVQVVTGWSLPLSVVSNSTISDLVFNSTSKTLAMIVSGPSGTKGYTNVTVARTLINDTEGFVVYIDESPIEYTVVTTDYSFLIHFVYGHSTHRVTVALTSEQASSPVKTSSEMGIVLVLLLIALIAPSYWISRKHNCRTKIERRKIE